jgi:hypothetical protein
MPEIKFKTLHGRTQMQCTVEKHDPVLWRENINYISLKVGCKGKPLDSNEMK